jgi:predicted nucleotidyltransferase
MTEPEHPETPLARIVTLRERKATEAARRTAAADRIALKLQTYAREHGGRYLLFGSAARSEMRFDSDIDVLVDFPEDQMRDAMNAAEDFCEDEGLPCDVLPFETRSRSFLDRVLPTAHELS